MCFDNLYYKVLLVIYINGTDEVHYNFIYFNIAIVQTIFLIFMVPSLTSSNIFRKGKQPDILLSTKLTPLQIIIGKLFASSLKISNVNYLHYSSLWNMSLIGGVR